MAEHADIRRPWSEPISEDTISAAVRFGQTYLIPHALAAFGLMGADPAIADARHVLRVLGDRDMNEFTKRNLFQIVRGRIKSVQELEPALVVLEEHGYIRERPTVRRSGPGRKPSPMYEVNPLWQPGRAKMPARRRDDAEFGASEESLDQNAQNAQNVRLGRVARDSADCEHCEEPATQQEVREWTAAL
jgi:hypothetical protein